MAERIMLVLNNMEDRRLLWELLESDYRVLAPEPDSNEMDACLEDAIDLLVADGASLEGYFGRIRLRKEGAGEAIEGVELG